MLIFERSSVTPERARLEAFFFIFSVKSQMAVLVLRVRVNFGALVNGERDFSTLNFYLRVC